MSRFSNSKIGVRREEETVPYLKRDGSQHRHKIFRTSTEWNGIPNRCFQASWLCLIGIGCLDINVKKFPIPYSSEELTQQKNSQCKALFVCALIQNALGIFNACQQWAMSRQAQQQAKGPHVLAKTIGIGNIHYLSHSFTTWKTVREGTMLSYRSVCNPKSLLLELV